MKLNELAEKINELSNDVSLPWLIDTNVEDVRLYGSKDVEIITTGEEVEDATIHVSIVKGKIEAEVC